MGLNQPKVVIFSVLRKQGWMLVRRAGIDSTKNIISSVKITEVDLDNIQALTPSIFIFFLFQG